MALRSRVAWEIFFVYRVLIEISERFPGGATKAIGSHLKDIKKAFDIGAKRLTLAEFLSSVKITTGFKIDSMGVTPVPDAYISAEKLSREIEDPPSDSRRLGLTLNLEAILQDVEHFLRSESCRVFILVDEIDQFVTHSKYETQKVLLQGLLEMDRALSKFDFIRLKIFIRDDLFEKLDFSRLGMDKVRDRAVELRWRDEDIRRFVAQRIFLNLKKICKGPIIRMEEKGLLLWVDTRSGDVHRVERGGIWATLSRVRKAIQLRFFEGDARDGDTVTLSDSSSRSVITLIFPREVRVPAHSSLAEGSSIVSIFDFLSKNFALSGRRTTPRVVLRFLKDCVEKAVRHHEDQGVVSVPRDARNEYPVITRRSIYEAYVELRSQVWGSVAALEGEWMRWIGRIRNLDRQRRFRFNDLRNIVRSNDRDAFSRFIAFLCHVGVLEVHNPGVPHEERVYTFPVLFLGNEGGAPGWPLPGSEDRVEANSRSSVS